MEQCEQWECETSLDFPSCICGYLVVRNHNYFDQWSCGLTNKVNGGSLILHHVGWVIGNHLRD